MGKGCEMMMRARVYMEKEKAMNGFFGPLGNGHHEYECSVKQSGHHWCF